MTKFYILNKIASKPHHKTFSLFIFNSSARERLLKPTHDCHCFSAFIKMRPNLSLIGPSYPSFLSNDERLNLLAPILDLTSFSGDLIALRYLTGCLFLFTWGLSLIGASTFWSSLWRSNDKLSYENFCPRILLGLSLQALFTFVCLYLGFHHPLLLIGVGTLAAISGGLTVWRSFQLKFPPLDRHLYAILLFAGMAAINLLRQFGLPSGQEAFQYSYFLPRLYNEQLSLFLVGPPVLHKHNFWGFEVLFTLGDAIGGWHLMQLQLFGYLLLTAFIGAYVLRKYGCSRFGSLLGGVLIMTTPFFIEHTWYVKPIPLVAGLSIFICTRILKQDTFSWKNALELCFISWLCIQLKLTSLVVIPVLFIFWIRSGFSIPQKISAVFIIAMLLCPWQHLRHHYSQNPNSPKWEVTPNHQPAETPVQSARPSSKLPPPSTLHATTSFLQEFKPWVWLLIIALPIAFFSGFKPSILCLYSLGLGIYLYQSNPYPAFGDAFRYTAQFTLLIPLAVAFAIDRYLLKNKLLMLLVCIGLTLIVFRRTSTSLDGMKYYKGYLDGSSSFSQNAKHLGVDLLSVYLQKRAGTDHLLYLGQANLVIRHPSIFPVGPWSAHLRWQELNKSDFLDFCYSNNIRYILYDHQKYHSYSRGFGGAHNQHSSATRYFKDAVKILGQLDPWVIGGKGGATRLIKLPPRDQETITSSLKKA